jgi:hypothetical protein
LGWAGGDALVGEGAVGAPLDGFGADAGVFGVFTDEDGAGDEVAVFGALVGLGVFVFLLAFLRVSLSPWSPSLGCAGPTHRFVSMIRYIPSLVLVKKA